MIHPFFLQQLKTAIREVPAFVAHSFADEDEEVVSQIIQLLTKLGLRCDSGKRAEPRGISEKIRKKIQAAEVFVAIFTRRDAIDENSYSTPPWVIEEKAAAIS